MTGANENPKPEKPSLGLDAPLIRPRKANFLSGIRSSFIAGIVVAAPVAITAYIVYWFVTSPMRDLDSFVRRILPAGDTRLDAITQAIPGFGVIIAIVAIVLLGAFAKNFVGRALIRTGERLLDSMPVIRNLHRFFKNVFETALQKSARSFKQVGLIPYPRQGLWAMAFVIGDAAGEVNYRLGAKGDQYLSVFVPTVPNPTSGFLIYVSHAEFIPLSMSIEDAAKVIFSLGLVVPEFKHPDEAAKILEQLAGEAANERKGILSRMAVAGRRES
jgi:uncharacterized membrane protein